MSRVTFSRVVLGGVVSGYDASVVSAFCYLMPFAKTKTKTKTNRKILSLFLPYVHTCNTIIYSMHTCTPAHGRTFLSVVVRYETSISLILKCHFVILLFQLLGCVEWNNFTDLDCC